MRRRKYLNYIRKCTGCAIMLAFMTLGGAGHHSASAVEDPEHSQSESTISEKEQPRGNDKTGKSLSHERIFL